MFRKYEFKSETEANTFIDGLGVDEEGNPSHSHSIVRLGNIVLTEGTYDSEGEVITEPVLSTNYHVDVLWQGDALSSWDNKMVWCPLWAFIPLEVQGQSLNGLKSAKNYILSISLNQVKKFKHYLLWLLALLNEASKG